MSKTTDFPPRNPSVGSGQEVRDREEFQVNFARTKQYQDSAIPYCQRLLNNYSRERRAGERAGAGAGVGAGAGAGEGAGAGARAGARAGGGRQHAGG